MRRASKIHTSLARQKSIWGVSSDVFGMEMCLIVLAINLHQVLLGLLVVPIHLFFRWVHKRDPLLMKAYLRYMKEPDMYDPWVRRPVLEERPKGFGKELHC